MEEQKKKDFFISYTSADRDWANWIAWILENAGYSIIIDIQDFEPGQNFIRNMYEAIEKTERIIAILSPNYFKSEYTGFEWQGAFANDSSSIQRLLIPILVRPSEIPAIFRSLIFIDLSKIEDESVAEERLLTAVAHIKPKAGSLPPRVKRIIFPTYPTKKTDTDNPKEELSPEFRTESSLNDKSSQRKKSSGRKKTQSSPATESTEVKKYAQTHVSKDDATANLDYLGRQNLVHALTDILAAKENFHHQTIGLLGDWGSGKSTFVNLLKSSLKKQTQTHFLFAEFNAWEYEHTDHMQAGIAREAMKGLVSDLGWWKKAHLAFQLAKAENPWNVMLLLTSTIVLMTSIIVSYSQLENPTEIAFVLSGIVGSGSAFILLKLFHSMQQLLKSPLVKEWKSYLTLPDYDRYLGTIPAMKQQINALCQLRLNIGKPVTEQKRLLYVVDDLDRCSHIGIVKTLEAVRLVMGIPQVIVIIAIDQRIALASLALHYKDLAGYHEQHNPGMIARDYLGKVIQLPVQLHAADADTITSFIESVLLNDSNTDLSAQESQKNTAKSNNNSDIKHELNETTNESSVQSQREVNSDNSQESITKIVEKIEYQLSLNEKQVFKERIKKFNFSNPRQIKRLYNSFNLLRHLLGSEQVNDHMLVLFWLEYLNSCNPDERKSVNEKRYEFLDEQFKNEDYYKKIERQVKSFVLPALEQFTPNLIASHSVRRS